MVISRVLVLLQSTHIECRSQLIQGYVCREAFNFHSSRVIRPSRRLIGIVPIIVVGSLGAIIKASPSVMRWTLMVVITPWRWRVVVLIGVGTGRRVGPRWLAVRARRLRWWAVIVVTLWLHVGIVWGLRLLVKWLLCNGRCS